jgi:hopanoid biosynthesis associated RND transporter like protein HpnN
MNPEPVPPGAATPVRRLLVALVSAVCRHPTLVLALSTLAVAASAFAAGTRLQYKTQRNDLISPRKESQQRWRHYLAEFGDDDDMVVVVRGHDRRRMEAALEDLAAKVRGRPELFDRLFYKVDLRPLRNRALMFLPVGEIEKIRKNLGGMGPLLDPAAVPHALGDLVPEGIARTVAPMAWQFLSLGSLLDEAARRAGARTPDAPLSADDEQFFTQLLAISRSAADTLADPAAYRNPWSSLMGRPPEQKDLLAEPQYFFSGDNGLAFLLVRPVKEQGSFTAALRSVTTLREMVARTRTDFPGIEFGLTGLPVLETDEMAAAQHDTSLASWLAIGGVALLFVVVYRGVAYPLLTVVTLLTGTAWALGWLTLTVGHLNILSATFAVMLIGMGDYGVLWVMRYEQARQSGMGVADALRHTAAHVAVGNLTAATTLALAFFAAILADFQAVAELGWIAGCGVLLCAFACFTVLPALLVTFDRRLLPAAAGAEWGSGECEMSGKRWRLDSPFPTPPSSLDRGWLPRLTARPGLVVAGFGAVALLLVGCAARVKYDHNLLHLQAANLDAVKWELTLIEHTAGASWHALSITDTPEEALALKARYERMPEVSRVVEVATLVPGDQDRKQALMADIQRKLRHLPPRGERIAHATPAVADLRTGVVGVLAKLEAAAPPAGLLEDLRRSLNAFLGKLSATDESMAADRLRVFEERMAGDLAEDLHRLRDVSTPAPIVVADLPPALRERYVGSGGKWLLRVFAKDCLWEFEPLRNFVDRIRTVDPKATGKPFGTVEGLIAMKDGLQRAGAYAFAVIVLVLLLDFRSLPRTLVAVAPLALGVGMTVGLMGLFGVPLNPANMIAFPLILGVGVDNGVHVLHDWLLRRGEGRATISHAIGRGVTVKAFTTMIGFGTLMLSTERGLAGLGLILTLGVCCSMLSALVLLPAALRLFAPQSAPVPAAQPAVPAQHSVPVRVAA